MACIGTATYVSLADSLNDKKLTAYESGARMPNKPFFHQDATRTIVWIEALYCGLRHAIVKALDTPEKATAVATHLASGKWDKKKGKRHWVGR
jgi:hypothetical protein